MIDLQNDYLWAERKPMFNYDTKTLMSNVNSAIRSYKDKGYDIIYIKHILPKLLWGVDECGHGLANSIAGIPCSTGFNRVGDIYKYPSADDFRSLCKDQLAGNVNRILFQFLGFLCAYIFNISAVDASVAQDVGITRSELFCVLYRCDSEQIGSCCKSRFDQFSATDRALIVHVITSSLL